MSFEFFHGVTLNVSLYDSLVLSVFTIESEIADLKHQSRAKERNSSTWIDGSLPLKLKFWVLNRSNIQDIFVSNDFD